MGKFEQYQPNEKARKVVGKFVETEGENIGRMKIDSPEAEKLTEEMAYEDNLMRTDGEYAGFLTAKQIEDDVEGYVTGEIKTEAMSEKRQEAHDLFKNPQYREPGNKRSGYTQELLDKNKNLSDAAKADAQEAMKYYEQVREEQDRLAEVRKRISETEAGDLIEKKLSVDTSYEDLEKMIPEVAAMKGFDQRSDFHDLTLDNHTKELTKNLEQDDFIKNLPQKTKDLVFLAAKLHDLGKMTEKGHQVNPKDAEKRQYIGHEKESERVVQEILPKHFDLSKEDIDFVAGLAGLHASALNLVNNFEKNRQPKGSELKAYDNFLKNIEDMPADIDTLDKLQIILALNIADKKAGANEQSDKNSEKVKKIMDSTAKQVAVMNEMKKAWPALKEAIVAKRGGDQKAGIIFNEGEYKYQSA
jgi:hypothetical protein